MGIGVTALEIDAAITAFMDDPRLRCSRCGKGRALIVTGLQRDDPGKWRVVGWRFIDSGWVRVERLDAPHMCQPDGVVVPPWRDFCQDCAKLLELTE